MTSRTRDEDLPDIEPPPGLPITDPHVVMAFDDDELVEGYTDGWAGDPRPGENRSLAYRHGWWKGMRDGGHRRPTPDDRALVRSIYKARGDVLVLAHTDPEESRNG